MIAYEERKWMKITWHYSKYLEQRMRMQQQLHTDMDNENRSDSIGTYRGMRVAR